MRFSSLVPEGHGDAAVKFAIVEGIRVSTRAADTLTCVTARRMQPELHTAKWSCWGVAETGA